MSGIRKYRTENIFHHAFNDKLDHIGVNVRVNVQCVRVPSCLETRRRACCFLVPFFVSALLSLPLDA